MLQPDSKGKAPPRTMVYAAALAIAGLVAFGASMLERTSTPSPQAASAPSARNTVERIEFDAGSAALPAPASEVLARVAQAARTSGASLLISGVHEHSADRARAVELATQRMQAVAHALEANGVATDRLILATPGPATSGGDERRVEIRMQ
jgi:outer membrane protein OmpA-like peptidoglycan-associated protein